MKKLFFSIFFAVSLFFITSNVSAETITNYSTKYYYYLYPGDRLTQTDYRSGTNNKVVLVGRQNSSDGNHWEYPAGFYNRINYSLSAGTQYQINVVLQFTDIEDSAVDSTWLDRNGDRSFAHFSAGTIVSNTYTYSKQLSTYIADHNYYTYTLNINYVVTPSSNVNSFYIGNYNNNAKSLGFFEHYLNSDYKVISITISSSNDGTIINQNQTIINQNQTMIDNQNQTNTTLSNIDTSITDSSTTGANSSASQFFSGFNTNTHGLTSIITAPLTLIGSITSSSCSPLGLPLPYVNKTLTLPCLSAIYSEYFGSFLTIYQTITFGIIAYWVCIRIFNLVKDFKNPDHDEIEVLDL